MNLIEWLQRIMVGFGAAWVMWLMIGLSVISVAIILERAWFFWSLRDDLVVLARDLRTSLQDSIEAAQKRMSASPSAEAAVVSAGLVEAHRGPKAAEEAMSSAVAIQKMKLERRLAYLGTLGNNAPFIGLFGTVIGVVGAFDALGRAAEKPIAAAGAAAQSMAPQAVMSSIAEALVATAVGLAVAIPAVAANNYFQRLLRSTLANTDALTHVLLAHLHGEAHLAHAGVAPSARKVEPVKPATNGARNKKAEAKRDDEDEDEQQEEG
ncbi:MotA/TolQ/ExbB proton channel family protein [Polyangium aurulentum]|uniref:MotA/TolQ/ExbB proton channel family protein n=1 Tax=Polyangium aurulentum TaxID=2567896 RepID=UPI0010AE709A|nr:MotA/TolQ/ExbB proton channel family protein [Polyangium aurulentum]UQA58722.1 MotA/TolQ/ExbB proton channel family protein [Polyangium aurulentum]